MRSVNDELDIELSIKAASGHESTSFNPLRNFTQSLQNRSNMPLFNHKDKHATDAPMTTGSAGAGTGIGSGTAVPATNRLPYEGTTMNTTNVMPGTGHHHDTIAGERHHPRHGQTGFENNDRYANEGYNAGVGTHQRGPMPDTTLAGGGVDIGEGAGNLPPANTLNRSDESRGGSGQSLTGKVERTVGTLVGSDTLKAKGLQKEQEAKAFKVQGAELAEAERLEHEALVRRERAVAHGAYPENKRLGAGLSGGMSGGH
ncbi:hypothetical protein D9615_005934 [Tricholomella constricta]|uniref:Uncharacterized protein n=1 Tax=Tricholomella constricta TaxID=117010 RepID=A0A8H5H9H0_9AGAR|nr:hypothetical protein D9615_005934 [Tricholomella constricta]